MPSFAELKVGDAAPPLVVENLRWAKQVWAGETLTFTAVVTGKGEEGGDDLVDLELKAANADGEEKLSGSATALVAP